LKQSPRRIKSIVFDLGRVVLDFDHRIAAEKISCFTDKPGEEIYNLFFDSRLTRLFEEGKITPREFFLEIKKTLKLKLSYRSFLPIWNEIFYLSEKNIAVHKLANALKVKYRLAILSNINILHLNFIKRNFSVLEAFHHVFPSCAMGAIKPDPKIFRKALEALSACPQDVFYTDDRPELIAGAKKLGIRAFVFKSAKQLKKDLLTCGVSVN